MLVAVTCGSILINITSTIENVTVQKAAFITVIPKLPIQQPFHGAKYCFIQPVPSRNRYDNLHLTGEHFGVPSSSSIGVAKEPSSSRPTVGILSHTCSSVGVAIHAFRIFRLFSDFVFPAVAFASVSGVFPFHGSCAPGVRGVPRANKG
jgi:hypothetical protein